MKTTIMVTLAALAAGSTLAMAQSSGGGAGGAAGAAAGAPSSPSGTGTTGAFNSGGVGVPGGAGPGDTTVRPNIPSMRQPERTVGDGPGGSFTTSPSGLNTATGTQSFSTSPSDPTAPPSGAPRIMVPERR